MLQLKKQIYACTVTNNNLSQELYSFNITLGSILQHFHPQCQKLMYKIVNMIIIIIIATIHATAASMHTQTRDCAFSLIILFTYCILPINGHKQETKSIKLTCCVLLASKFVDITEISLGLFMEADAGWYNTEKMELSSSFSNIDPTMLCHMVNVDTQFPVSFLANSASVQSHATHFRAQSKSFFPSNFSKCFSS